MIFPCRGGKHHKCYKCFSCRFREESPTLYADNKPFKLKPSYYCRTTPNPLYCDWKRMLKFWKTKWFSKDKRFRCGRLCLFCGFRKEYYGSCIFDLTDFPHVSLTPLERSVVSGGFGTGVERRKALEAAGYDYEAIQNSINEKLSGGSRTYKYAERRRRELKKSNKIFGIVGVLLCIIGIGGAAMLKTTETTVRTVTVQNDIRPETAEQHTLPYQDFRSNIMRYHYDMYSSQWAYDLSVADAQPNPYEPFIVECSAYCYNGRCTASGKPTIEGVTIAGKKEWLGRTALLYEVNDDGGIGEFIGYREFTDTGYGKDSTLYPGYGTIQTGECVDLYFDDEQTALEWGRRKIYIQVINGCG